MTELSIAKLDTKLENNQALISLAGEALLTFRDIKTGGFFRESSPSESSVPVVGATSTARSIIALCDLATALTEDGFGNSEAELANRAQEAVRGFYTGLMRLWLMGGPDCIADASANRSNAFTDAQIVVAATASQHLLKEQKDERHERASSLIGQRLAELKSSGWRGRVQPDEKWGHDFVTLYLVRAASLTNCWDSVDSPSVSRRVARDVAQHLGWFAARSSTRFDPGELAMGLALLGWLDPGEADRLLDGALDVLEESQSEDGAWPTSRVISQTGGKLLHIASYDVALALAILLQGRLDGSMHRHSERILNLIDKTIELARGTYVGAGSRSHNLRGWGNDRTRYADTVESWATSVVLMLLCRRREILLTLRESAVLARLGTSRVRVDGSSVWPDLRRWENTSDGEDHARAALDSVSDPFDSGILGERVFETFVRPILEDPSKRPSSLAASLVIPGPPGTRKTTLARLLAASLGWPLVILTPPSFLHDGIDGVERSADRVFGDLLRLRRAVVLFDECEDLFRSRSRGPGANAGYRTAGAFITAGMLPRLQALRDKHWVIFALAFNGEIHDIDEAVVRPGRFDYTIRMTHPGPEAQNRYLRTRLAEDAEGLRVSLDVVQTYALKKSTQDKLVQLTWGHIEQLIRDASKEEFRGNGGIDSLVRRLMDYSSAGPPALVSE